MDSILNSIKKLLGIDADYTEFDADVLVHINAAFMVLNQLGYPNYSITDASATWNDYCSSSEILANECEAVKQFVYLRTRLAFDPPANSFTQQSIKDMIDELEWRLNVQLETESLCPVVEEVTPQMYIDSNGEPHRI